MKISIIITSYNSAKTISRCLESVRRQSFPVEYEILVVDSSRDNTPAIIRDKFPQAKLRHFAKRKLPGEALNIGLREAGGELIAFIPSDCLAHPDWIKNKIPYLQNGYVAVAGAIGNASPGSLVGWLTFFIEHTTNSPGRPAEDFTGRLTHGFTYWRKIYDQYGPYVSGIAAAEDNMFNVKLARAREPVFFASQSRIFHLNTSGLLEFIRHQYSHGRSYGAGLRQGLLTNPRLGTEKSPKNFLSWLISYPVFWLRGIWRNVRRWTPGLLPLFSVSLPLLVVALYACTLGVMKEIFFHGE